jgi:hypothetical protein
MFSLKKQVFVSALLATLAFVSTNVRGDPSPTEQLPSVDRQLVHDGQDYKVESYGRNYKDFVSDLPVQYRPENKVVFQMKSYWVDAKDWHVFEGSGFDPELQKTFTRSLPNGGTLFRLLVHPASEKFFAPFLTNATPGEDFLATPLASSRTLVVWQPGHEKEALLAKVSLDANIGGSWRIIRPAEIARSVGTNNLLATIRENLPKNFLYFPEVLGLTPKGADAGGMLLRKIPDELKNDINVARPIMSLFESKTADDPPAFVAMIKKSGLSSTRFFKKYLLKPFIEQWLELALQEGINEEPHSQNLLMVIGPDGLPNGEFAHWDLGGFSLDLKYREENHLPVPDQLPNIRGVDLDYSQDAVVKRYRSLKMHFVNGVIYNLDQRIPMWVKKGWLKEAPPAPDALEHEFNSEFHRQFVKKTGIEPLDYARLDEFGQNILRGRENIVKRKKERSLRKVVHCWTERARDFLRGE